MYLLWMLKQTIMQWWCYLSQCGVAFYVFMTFFAYWSLLLLCQCIQGLPEGALRRIILTASGGAFRQVHSHMCLCTSRNIRIHLISIDHYRSHINWSLQRLASWQIERCKSRWRIKASKLEYGEEDHSRFCNFIQQGDLELYHISFENFTEPVFSPIKHWSDNLIILGLRSYRSTLFIWLWIRWHWDCDSPTVYHTLYGWNPGELLL